MNIPFDISPRTAIIFCGIQACGKTSLYQQHLADKGLAHINMDTLHTRNKERQMMEDCAANGLSVVVDNTNPTRADREKYIRFFHEHGYRIIGIYFQSNVHKCLKRNAEREQRVRDLAVLGTYGKLEIPAMSEGFDELYYAKIENDNFTLNTWDNEL